MISGLNQAKLQDSIMVNLGTAHPSRATGMVYTSMFPLNGTWYGINAAGIFRLDGDDDYTGHEVLETQIDADIIFPTTNLEDTSRKLCRELTLSCRGSGDLVAAVTVDEADEVANLEVRNTEVTGIVRRRVKNLPRGCKGVNWRFRVSNVAGSRFELLQADVDFVPTARSI